MTNRYDVSDAADICSMHKRWLGGVYTWAGQYRGVNIEKGGFPFAASNRVEGLMEDLESRALARCTPCGRGEVTAVSAALAEVHVELVLIHPFREGNGRIARLLATLMALQAGLDRNYRPMTDLFTQIIYASGNQ